MAGPEDKKVIKELITHVNRIDSKIKDLETTTSDMNDLQLLNKLDIIHLKNEVDKLRLMVPEEREGEMPAEMRAEVVELPEEEPEEGPPKAEEKMPQKRDFIVCEGCGAILPLKAKFCGKCGKTVKG